MALDDVLNATGNYKVFQGENVGQSIDYTKTYDLVRNYLASTGRAESMPERPTPEYIGAVASKIREETESNLAKTVSENYKEIISELGEEEMRYLAVQYGLPEELILIREAIRNGDVRSLNEKYRAEIAKDPLLAAGADYLQDSELLEIMERKYRARESNFLAKNFFTEKEKGKPEFDIEKAQKYISETISKLDNKKKNESYLILGQIYYQKKAKEEAKRKK
jgi:hypothetical protein